ncbi:MAG: type II secretion system protein [Acidimicrobiales bacterium]
MNGETVQPHVPSVSRRQAIGKAHGPSRRTRPRDGGGFTLIELLIVVTIIPLIVGALAAGLISVFSLQSGVSNRLGDSADAQVVAASFTKDVQSASSITTDPTLMSPSSPLPFCGSGSLLLGLQWGGSSEAVAYVEQLQSGLTYSLVRNECDSGPWTAPTSSTVVSYDLLPPCPIADSAATCSVLKEQPAPVASWSISNPPDPTQGLVTTDNMTELSFPISEPASSYAYSLSATPAGAVSTPVTNLGQPNTDSSCGFALPQDPNSPVTEPYAGTLCFVGFNSTEVAAAYPNSPTGGGTCTQTDPGQQGTDVYVDVPGGYVMSFCLTIVPSAGENQSPTGQNPLPVEAVPTPVGGGNCDPTKSLPCKWGEVSNGEGFLGNEDELSTGTVAPFYAGIGCPDSTLPVQNNVVTSSCINPALFQTTNKGLDNVTLSNILVTDPAGDVATGYEVVTLDAETIDPGGFIKWTSSLPVSSPLTFQLLPNFGTSELGNACNNVPAADNANQTGWSTDNGFSSAMFGGTTYLGLLTGLGSASVECSSTWQTQPNTQNPSQSLLRTGTVMLGLQPQVVNGATEPVTIKAQLQGEGYNAVAFGLLLP